MFPGRGDYYGAKSDFLPAFLPLFSHELSVPLHDRALFLAKGTTGNDISDFVFFFILLRYRCSYRLYAGTYQAYKAITFFFRITITRNPDSPDSIVVSATARTLRFFLSSFFSFFFFNRHRTRVAHTPRVRRVV